MWIGITKKEYLILGYSEQWEYNIHNIKDLTIFIYYSNVLNLSNRSINLLKNDNIARYKWYVMKERESEFQTYFALGKAFASLVEEYHKTWERNIERHAKAMEQEFIIAQAEDYDKYLIQLHELAENAKLVITMRCGSAEYESIIPINDEYSLKCKYDALRDDIIEDYKSVATFSKEEEKEEKYWQQMRLYQYSEYKRTGNKLRGKITEIKKWKATLPKKKEDIIAMIPEWIDTSGTVVELKQRLQLHTTKEQISQEIYFEWEESIIPYIEDLIRRAILKANYLKSLPSLDDVL